MPPAPPPELPEAAPPMADFLRDLAASGLLGADAAARELAAAPPEARGNAERFLNHLVARGTLTHFQAERLARRQIQGLTVGPYRLLTPVGRGGVGVVYLAAGAADDLVALKILPPARVRAEPRSLERFRRELAIGRRAPAHSNLTQTLDGGEAHGVHYLALEYVRGATLRQHVQAHGTLSVGEAARLFTGLAEGLHALHEAGVVHRDLKPGNVILTPDGDAKLLDYGFALVRGEERPADPAILGGPGYTLGTMDYLPPEQSVDAATVGPAADLYALGCSLYFAFTGKVPYPGGTAHEKIRKHRTDAIPDIHFENPTVPSEFAQLVAWLMAKRPAQRPHSAEEFAGHLRAWADPPPAKPKPATRRAIVRAAEAVRLTRRAEADDSAETAAVADEDGGVEPMTRLPAPRRLVALALAGVVALAFALGFALASSR